MPLAASVTARGAEEPAFSVAFTEVSFEAPDPSVFVFTPAEGTAVTEHEVPLPTVAELEQWKAEARPMPDATAPDTRPRPRDRRGLVRGGRASGRRGRPVGQAADTRAPRRPTAAARARMATDAGSGLDEASAMLDSLTQPRRRRTPPQTSLVSVLFADDGRVLVGAVTPERLLDAAATGR